MCMHMDTVCYINMSVKSKCKEIPFWIIIYIVVFFPFFVFFREPSIHQGKLVNCFFHRVLGLPRNTCLNVLGVQMALQKEVQAAVGEQKCILQNSAREKKRGKKIIDEQAWAEIGEQTGNPCNGTTDLSAPLRTLPRHWALPTNGVKTYANFYSIIWTLRWVKTRS